MVEGFTYRRVGMAREPDQPPPEGFHRLRVSTRLGTGAGVQRAAVRALFDWRMHRAAGLTVAADAPSARTGARVTLGLGVGPLRLRAPCRVAWTDRAADRAAWAYGTLPGHPQCGEEAFVIRQLPDGAVWLTVTAVSRPAAWYARAAGPAGRWAQRGVALAYGRALRRLVRARR